MAKPGPKKTFSEEQENIIVEDYYNSPMSRAEIAEKYNISQGLLKSIITSYNKRQGISSRGNKAPISIARPDATEITRELFPVLFEEVNENVDLTKLMPGSHRKIEWKCRICGHEWKSELRTRTKIGCGCPVCNAGRHKKSTGTNIAKEGNSIVELFPKKMKYWNKEENVKLGLDPHRLSANTEVAAWWTCPRCGVSEHTSIAGFLHRTYGCLECHKGFNSSFGEVVIAKTCQEIFGKSKVAERDTSLGFEIDVLVSSASIGFEFCGWHWHEDKLMLDNDKIIRAAEHGITLYTIYDGVPKDSVLKLPPGSYSISRKTSPTSFHNTLLPILASIFESMNIDIGDMKWDDLLLSSLKVSAYEKIPYERTLAAKIEGIEKIWDYEKNSRLLPSDIAAGSHAKVWLICDICGESYERSAGKIRKGARCRKCSHIKKQ